MASVTRTAQRTRTRRREELLATLADAVEGLLADATYTELSVARLVQAAGISRSTFYVYFEDKGDVLQALTEGVISELIDAARLWWEMPPDAPKDELRRRLGGIVTTYRPHTALMAAADDAAAYDPAVRDEVVAMMDANIAGLRQHIRGGQAGGWIAGNLPPAETASWLTWMAERGFPLMLRGAGDDEVGPLVDAYTDVVWNALYAFAPNRAGRQVPV